MQRQHVDSKSRSPGVNSVSKCARFDYLRKDTGTGGLAELEKSTRVYIVLYSLLMIRSSKHGII